MEKPIASLKRVCKLLQENQHFLGSREKERMKKQQKNGGSNSRITPCIIGTSWMSCAAPSESSASRRSSYKCTWRDPAGTGGGGGGVGVGDHLPLLRSSITHCRGSAADNDE